MQLYLTRGPVRAFRDCPLLAYLRTVPTARNLQRFRTAANNANPANLANPANKGVRTEPDRATKRPTLITIDQTSHRTIADAAHDWHVSTRTVRTWIDKRIIPPPPTIEHGTQVYRIFPPEYMKAATVAIKAARARKHQG